MDETLSELRKNGPSNEDKAACNSPATPDAHPGRTRFIRKVLNGVAAALGIGTGLAATACNTPKPPVIEREATAVLPTPTEQLVPSPLPQKTEVPPSPSSSPTPSPSPVPAIPTEEPEPSPTRVARNMDTTSKFDGAPSPVWDPQNRTWEEIRNAIGKKNFLPTSPVDPVDAAGSAVKMEVQLIPYPNKDEIRNIAYVYPSLSEGTKVRAISSGIITSIKKMADTQSKQDVGYQITLTHDSGAEVIYSYIHGNEPLLVNVGDYVEQGQSIAKIGKQELPHIMPWDLQIFLLPFVPPNEPERLKYVSNYQVFWYSWPPISAKENK